MKKCETNGDVDVCNSIRHVRAVRLLVDIILVMDAF